MLKTVVLATLVLSTVSVRAQSPPLDRANAAFNGLVIFKYDRQDRLVMDFFDGGNRFRQDIARLSDLDPNAVTFSAEEDAVVLKCSADRPQCFTKEIFKMDVVRLTGRSTLPRPTEDVAGEQTIVVLQDLIRAAHVDLVQIIDETPSRSPRKSQR